MFKLLAILPFVNFLAGTVVAAPVFSDMSLEARKSRKQAAAATGGKIVPCTKVTDFSVADFGGGTSPDEALTLCSLVDAPDVGVECTNIQAVADAFNLPLVSLKYCERWSFCSPPAAVPIATGETVPAAVATPAAAATGGKIVPVVPSVTDFSVADFGGGTSPDEALTLCSLVDAPDVGVECTNIQAVADAFNLPLHTRLRGLNVHIPVGNSVVDNCAQYSEYWVSDVSEPTYVYSFHECIHV
ncbi:hypothetical protein B0H19DRAFT_1270728 [Mycena capillaripes]|nr:hypothetical protein B0H19DRAFT_1270728 [Mycena capillaripes]